MGHMFLVVVDVHSRWPEIQMMENITTDVTMDALTELFSRYGICDTLMSDNCATFVSEKFQKFLKVNGIVHKTTRVYKPSTNGLAERMVQSFKQVLEPKSTIPVPYIKNSKFLLMYRSTVNTTTQETPSMLFLKRNIKTRIQLAKPNPEDIVNRNKTSKEEIVRRSFRPGD